MPTTRGNFNSIKSPYGHVRDDKDCSIYYNVDYLSRKICPNKGCNAIWRTYKELEKHLTYRCHIIEKEQGKYRPITTTCRQLTEETSISADYAKKIYIYIMGTYNTSPRGKCGRVRYAILNSISTNGSQIIMRVNSKQPDKDYRENRWSSYKEQKK